MDYFIVTFHKRYKPLPPGYRIVFDESHYRWEYLWDTEDEVSGCIDCNLWRVRRSIFKRYEERISR